MSEGDGTRVVDTYEELRTETTVLLVNATDVGGKSQMGFYGVVAVDDVMEWRTGERCWVRYRIAELQTGTAMVTQYAVEPYSYAYGGCSGTVPGELNTEFRWRPPDLSLGNIGDEPFMHGPIFVSVQGWSGTKPPESTETPPLITWPPSTLPSLDLDSMWTGGIVEAYGGGLQGEYTHAVHGWALSVSVRRLWTVPDAFDDLDVDQEKVALEYRVIDGHPSVIWWDLVIEGGWSGANVMLYDEKNGLVYGVHGVTPPVPGEAGGGGRDRPAAPDLPPMKTIRRVIALVVVALAAAYMPPLSESESPPAPTPEPVPAFEYAVLPAWVPDSKLSNGWHEGAAPDPKRKLGELDALDPTGYEAPTIGHPVNAIFRHVRGPELTVRVNNSRLNCDGIGIDLRHGSRIG